MIKEKPENPAAFPLPDERAPDGSGIREGERGMSLRDWFAGQALAGILSGAHPICKDIDAETSVSTAAYAMADAMLAERVRK